MPSFSFSTASSSGVTPFGPCSLTNCLSVLISRQSWSSSSASTAARSTAARSAGIAIVSPRKRKRKRKWVGAAPSGALARPLRLSLSLTRRT